jgi:hypothetical protein
MLEFGVAAGLSTKLSLTVDVAEHLKQQQQGTSAARTPQTFAAVKYLNLVPQQSCPLEFFQLSGAAKNYSKYLPQQEHASSCLRTYG